MSLIEKLRDAFSGMSPEPAQVEIKPTVKPGPEIRAPERGTTLEQAATKHGRAFKAQSEVKRITPPSRDLQELNKKSDDAKAKSIVVTDISSWRKS